MKSFLNKLTNWYFSRSALPYWSILLIDCLCVLVAGVLAYAIKRGIPALFYIKWDFFLIMIGVLALYMIGFRIFKTYFGVLRYSSFKDLIRISLAVLVGASLVVLVENITGIGHRYGIGRYYAGIGIAEISLTGLFTIAFMWIIRIWVKTLHDEKLDSTRSKPVFIYGVREGGVAIAKSINAMEKSPYKVAGFVSNSEDMKNRWLMGHRVYEFNTKLASVMNKNRVFALMVSPLMMKSLRENQEVMDTLLDEGIKLYVTPQAKEWDGKQEAFDVLSMRQVEPEDLLPRDKIEIDLEAAAKMINGKVVLITGAAGSIGSEIVRQVADFSPGKLILIDQAETPMHDIRLMMKKQWPQIDAMTIVANIADQVYMKRIFSMYKPDYVFHAAAYKHVPMMEDNPYEAVVNNVWGTKIMADLAVACGTKKFVMVSTDKAVNPTNVMGCSKRICEIYVQSLDKAIKEGKVKGETGFVTTRFGNVLGSNGSVIPIFQEQIKKGGPVTVTHPEIIRYFMLIPEACKLVVEAGTMGKGGEIFVFDMGQPVKIADLAERMIKLSGAKDVKIEFTGLRDGEKLYEEVLNDEETTLPTFHPKIKIAKVREYDFDTAQEEITQLISEAENLNDMDIVAEMKHIVPEFKSHHSKYEVLD